MRIGKFFAAAFGAALAAALLLPLDPAAAQVTGTWTMTKTPSPTTYSGAGQVINYTYVITDHTGSNNNIVEALSDDKATISDCSFGTPVPPNGSTTCHGTYTTTAADVTAGSVTNHAAVTGSTCGGDGCELTASAQATVNFVGHPSWTLVKTPSPTTYTAAGQAINYSYLLKNTGDVTISSISITDTKVAAVSCPVSTLAAGASTTCTGSYTTTAADTTAGSVTNTATANGTASSGSLSPASANATVTFTAQPSWTLAKTPNPTTYSAAGQAISYSYALSNTGNVTISSISITDTKVAAISCPVSTVSPGAHITCTGTYTTTAADVTAGSITNTATAHGTPSSGSLSPATANATITFTAQPAWTLTKTPNPTTYSGAAQAIKYTYVLTNTGNVTISSIALTDNKVASVSCPASTLAPAANMSCTGTYTTTAADVTAGSVTNSATANGTPSSGSLSPATANATITFTSQPAWTLTKAASPTTYSAAGQAINYSYVLTNTGNTTISSITITDSKIASVSCPATSLAPGANMTCSATYTTTAGDVTAGSVANTATAKGAPAAGALAPVTAQTTIVLVGQASWTLTKSASPITYSTAGQSITYSYVLTNTGNLDIGAITVTDNKVASLTCPAVRLSAGTYMTCTGTYTTTAADVGAGTVTNTATASGTPATGALAPVTAQTTIKAIAPANGSLTIVALAASDPTFNFTSTIAGAASFSLATVSGTASRTFVSLAAGTYTITEINLPLHWTLSTLTCTGDTGGKPTTVNLSSQTATVGLDNGEAITCTFTNVFQLEQHIQQTQAIIQGFLSRRIQLLADDGPDRNRFIRRVPGALWGDVGPDTAEPAPTTPLSFTGNGGDAATQMSMSTSLSQLMAYAKSKSEPSSVIGKAPPKPAATYDATPGVDVWIEAHFNQFVGNAGTLDNRGHFNVVYLGADYLFMRSVLAGMLVQFDWAGESSAALNSSISGRGWMAGPYVSARLSSNFFFDARAAWGTSTNSINPFGLYEDRFSTNRWLVQGNLTGNWWMGNFRVTPSAGVTFIGEKQLNYTDSLGITIPEQTVSLGRFAFGPEFGYRILGANGITYEPHVAIKGIWDFVRPDATTISGITVGNDAIHAMAQAGLMARAANGYAIRIVGQYDGIGSSNFHSYGGQVWVNIPLH